MRLAGVCPRGRADRRWKMPAMRRAGYGRELRSLINEGGSK